MYWNQMASIKIETGLKININMRCIEIFGNTFKDIGTNRLTLTWDVLKSKLATIVCSIPLRLTLTWDVLK